VQELYHELHALDRFDQDYRRKLQEEDNSNATQRGKCCPAFPYADVSQSWVLVLCIEYNYSV